MHPSPSTTWRGLLKLYDGDDKARLAREQPIPAALAEKLKAFEESGEALRLYRQHTARRDAKMEYPANPLLFIPQHASRMLNEDLERSKQTGEGKLDFHSLRVAYINLLFKTGSDPKTTQELARHVDPRLTMIIYGRAEAERKQGAVEAVYEFIRGQKKQDEIASNTS